MQIEVPAELIQQAAIEAIKPIVAAAFKGPDKWGDGSTGLGYRVVESAVEKCLLEMDIQQYIKELIRITTEKVARDIVETEVRAMLKKYTRGVIKTDGFSETGK